jgi:hypothetical protein
MKKYYTVKYERNMLHTTKRREAKWTSTSYVENALLKERYKGREDEEEDTSNY